MPFNRCDAYNRFSNSNSSEDFDPQSQGASNAFQQENLQSSPLPNLFGNDNSMPISFPIPRIISVQLPTPTPLQTAEGAVDEMVSPLVPGKDAQIVTNLQDAILSGNCQKIGQALASIGSDWTTQTNIAQTVTDDFLHNGSQIGVFATQNGYIVSDNTTGLAVNFSLDGKPQGVSNAQYIGSGMTGPVPEGMTTQKALSQIGHYGVEWINYDGQWQSQVLEENLAPPPPEVPQPPSTEGPIPLLAQGPIQGPISGPLSGQTPPGWQ